MTPPPPATSAFDANASTGRRGFHRWRLPAWIVPHRRTTKIAIACIALCVLLRAPFLSSALNIDEGGDALVAIHWFTGSGSVYGSYWLDRPPLLLLLYRVALFGGQLGVRLLGTFVAAAMIWCVVQIARRLGGVTGATYAGLLAALFASQTILGAVFSDAELLATAPAAASILTLLMAMRGERRPAVLLVLSGLFASCALLIKQSSLDPLAAGCVYLAASAVFERSHWIGWKRACSYLAGVTTPIAAVAIWAHFVSLGIGHFLFAMFGFRLDGLALLQSSADTPLHRMLHVGLPLLFSTGMGLLMIWLAAWLWSRRKRRVETAVLGAWAVFAMVGLLGGGNYWPHYFIQLIPVLSALGASALASSRHIAWRRIVIGYIVFAAVLFTGAGIAVKYADPPQQEVLTVADYLHQHAAPSDTIYVMYARANLVYYAGLPSPFPYNWSLMDEAMPQAQAQLREYLRSPTRRPVWLVEWQTPGDLGLDNYGSTGRLVHANYHLVANVCGRNIYLRNDRIAAEGEAGQVVNCSESPVANSVYQLSRKLGFVPPDAPSQTPDWLDYLWS